MTFKDKLKRFYAKIYGIMNKIYATIRKYSPIDEESGKLILFGLFINALSNYTAGDARANTATLVIVFLALAFLKNRKE